MAEHRSAIDISAAPERVFQYLVTDAGITAWMGEWARVEPVVGGQFAVDIVGYGARGTYLEVDPPRKVTVSWGLEGSDPQAPGSSTVSFALSPPAGRRSTRRRRARTRRRLGELPAAAGHGRVGRDPAAEHLETDAMSVPREGEQR